MFSLLASIFAVISIPCYVILLVAIVKNRRMEPFHSSFFKICLSLGLADVSMLTFTTIFFKLRALGCLDFLYMAHPHGWLPKLTVIIAWYLGFNQTIGITALSLNRCCAMSWPVKYNHWWTPAHLRNIIVVQWAIPFCCITPLFATSMSVVKFRNRTEILIDDKNYSSAYFLSLTAISVFIVIPTLTALYLFSFYRLYRHTTSTSGRQQSLRRKPSISRRSGQTKLAVTAFVLFLTLLFLDSVMVMATIWSLTHQDTTKENIYITTLWPIANDIFSGANPWVLLSLSKVTRKHMYRLFWNKKRPSNLDASSSQKEERLLVERMRRHNSSKKY